MTTVVIQSASTLWPTVVGAGAAVAGGFLAAWWQTSRADDVAQRIRQAERREVALLVLGAKIPVVRGALASLYAGDPGGLAVQYERAGQVLSDFMQFWDSEVSGRIPDQEVRSAYIELWTAFYTKLPVCGFSAQRLQEELAGEGADRRFYEGLSAVQDGVIALWDIVNELVRNLPHPARRRWFFAVAKLWSRLRRT